MINYWKLISSFFLFLLVECNWWFYVCLVMNNVNCFYLCSFIDCKIHSKCFFMFVFIISFDLINFGCDQFSSWIISSLEPSTHGDMLSISILIVASPGNILNVCINIKGANWLNRIKTFESSVDAKKYLNLIFSVWIHFFDNFFLAEIWYGGLKNPL